MSRSGEIKECRDCGGAVLNERRHREFHRNIVTVSAQPSDPTPESRIRFIGETTPSPDPDWTPNP